MAFDPRPGRVNPRPYLIAAIIAVLLLLVLLLTRRNRPEAHSPVPTQPAAGPRPARAEKQVPAVVIDRPEIPGTAGGQVIQRAGYTLCYDEAAEQPSWVAYVLTAAEVRAAHLPRTNRFLRDPNLSTGSADDADYEGSGYDRGHLAPAEDLSYSAATMRESFYYSNMSPQLPAFNRGTWKRLEELVRYWAATYDSLAVVTGPVLAAGLPVIGHNAVAVPAAYYKVVLRYSASGVEAIGFLVPHAASGSSLRTFAVPVDEVEKRTGIDFFPQLPDSLETAVEAKLGADSWLWRRVK
ncbi:MAG: non-specific endonuclease [Flaviaesturariibacter sp.]|nr:non-specific endonuclease [Flaviaesturariibacter sp.]